MQVNTLRNDHRTAAEGGRASSNLTVYKVAVRGGEHLASELHCCSRLLLSLLSRSSNRVSAAQLIQRWYGRSLRSSNTQVMDCACMRCSLLPGKRGGSLSLLEATASQESAHTHSAMLLPRTLVLLVVCAACHSCVALVLQQSAWLSPQHRSSSRHEHRHVLHATAAEPRPRVVTNNAGMFRGRFTVRCSGAFVQIIPNLR